MNASASSMIAELGVAERALADVEAVIESDVRPRIQAHGGDIAVSMGRNGVIDVSFHGACRGCPALAMTYFGAVRTKLLLAGVDAEINCAQVNVSVHAQRRLESLWGKPREDKGK